MPRRRQPNFAAFLGTGAVVGLLVGFVVALLGPSSGRYGIGPEAGYIGVLFAGLGVLLAGVLAVLLDRRR